MRRRFLGAALAAAMLTSALMLSSCGENAAPASVTVEASVGVDALMRHPDKYNGAISVEGVVSAVSPEQKLLALIDLSEFEECGVTTCSTLALPVKWDGPMPAVNDEILLKGEIRDVNGKFVFVAKALENSHAGSREETNK